MFDQPLFLDESEAHLWYFQTNRFSYGAVPKAMHYLDEQERQRYTRLLNPLRRHQFVMGRALLKQVLACYLRCSAEAILLFYTEQQKPFVDADLTFNISHSGQHVLIGVARRALGVDIQEEAAITRAHVLHGLSVQERHKICQDTLFRYWVLKEALWKADNQQTNIAPLLDAITTYPIQEPYPTFFPVGSWSMGYLNLGQNLHMGWAVDHPQPVWKLNGKLLETDALSFGGLPRMMQNSIYHHYFRPVSLSQRF
ncbi:MAG: hypothetical protein RIG62_00610 [Cyclobacteriaceae bacterium]